MITKDDDIIRRFWPVSKAKALVANGNSKKEKLVLEAHFENERARPLNILQEREHAEEITRTDHKQPETITNILSVPFLPTHPSFFMRLFFMNRKSVLLLENFRIRKIRAAISLFTGC